jgi:GNAT superfamily N-acetyltransferase
MEIIMAQSDTQPLFTIRLATQEDIETLLDFRVTMFHDIGYSFEELARMEKANREYLMRAVPAGEYLCWLAEVNGEPVSGGAYTINHIMPDARFPTGEVGYILSMYTRPEWRKKGMASAILEIILEDMRKRGFRFASLHASREGRPLYERFGFEASNEMRLRFD